MGSHQWSYSNEARSSPCADWQRPTTSSSLPDVALLPDPHPDSPGHLARLRLPILETRRPWTRTHAPHYGPLYFGRSEFNRFDAPAGQYGVLYVAADAEGAFI